MNLSKLILTFIAINVAVVAAAQNMNVHVDVSINYDNLRIMGLTEDELVNFDESWNESKEGLFIQVCYGANRELINSRVKVGRYPDETFKVVIEPLIIDADGDSSANVYVYKDGNLISGPSNIRGSGEPDKMFQSVNSVMRGSVKAIQQEAMMSRVMFSFYSLGMRCSSIVERSVK